MTNMVKNRTILTGLIVAGIGLALLQKAQATQPQWLRGDLNHNGIPADAGDLVLMERATIGEIPATSEYDLNWNGIPADAGDLELMKLASVGYIDLNNPKPILLDEIISYVNNNIIVPETYYPDYIQYGSSSPDGSNPYEVFCTGNAVIRKLIFEGGTTYDNLTCYWKNNQGGWINYNYPNPLGIKTYITVDSSFAHMLDGIPIDQNGDLTNFDNWVFFQYDDRNVKPLSFNMPGNEYVTVYDGGWLQCMGISAATPVAKWFIDEQGIVTRVGF